MVGYYIGTSGNSCVPGCVTGCNCTPGCTSCTNSTYDPNTYCQCTIGKTQDSNGNCV
jgi:hypothetical protein